MYGLDAFQSDGILSNGGRSMYLPTYARWLDKKSRCENGRGCKWQETDMKRGLVEYEK